MAAIDTGAISRRSVALLACLAMIGSVIWSLIGQMHEPYAALFLGLYVFYAGSANAILLIFLSRKKILVGGFPATESVALVYCVQLILGWVAFGFYIYQVNVVGYPSEFGVVLAAVARRAFVVQQVVSILGTMLVYWRTSLLDRVVAGGLVALIVVLTLPNF